MSNIYDTSMYPLGSLHPKVLFNNASNLDDGSMNNVTSRTWIDRFGRTRKSWWGFEQDFIDFMLEFGFEPIHLTYVPGTPLTVLRATQLIDYLGNVYKVKQPAVFPFELTGTWATDAPNLVDVGDAALRALLLGDDGDMNIGSTNADGVTTTVGARLDLIDHGTIYSDDPLYATVQDAADAMGDSTVLVLRGTINLTTHLTFWNKVNPVVIFAPGCHVIGVRPFSFDAGLRGILDFYECSNPIVYRPRITGVNEVKVFPATIPSFQMDGDSGIEFIRCDGARVIGEKVAKLDYFMGWGVIYVECTDVGTQDCEIEWCTQQSGIGHAGVQGGFCTGNTIRNVGLYGVEVEGANSDILVDDNWVDDVLQGVCFINALTSSRATRNRISRAVYGMTSNAVGTADSANEFANNTTYDCLMHFQIVDSNFLSIHGNQSYSRAGVASAYIHQRAADFVWVILDSTSVLLPDFATANVVNGDIHEYAAAGFKTVQSFGVWVDATMGNCMRVTYVEGTAGMLTGDMFRRFTDLQAANSRWMYAGGNGLSNIEVHDNVAAVASHSGIAFAGTVANWHSGNNKIRGVKYAYAGEDATPITDSTISIKSGDCTPTIAMFLGNAPLKLFPSVRGERHSFTIQSKTIESGFVAGTGDTAVSVKVAIYNSNAASAPVDIMMNTAIIATIPAAEFGIGIVQRTIPVNLAPGAFTFSVVGGGAMTLGTANFEVNIAPVS